VADNTETSSTETVIPFDAFLEITADIGDTGLNGADVLEQIVKNLQKLITRFTRTDDIYQAHVPIYRDGEHVGNIDIGPKKGGLKVVRGGKR
jgi:hypothetical protein